MRRLWPALPATALAWLGMCVTASAGSSLGGISLTLVTLGHTGTGFPTALYVDQDSIGGRCSDRRSPSQVNLRAPWCTITHAFAAAPAGSTVYVRAGTYPAVTIPAFAPSSTVTFAAKSGETPVIQGMNVGSSGSTSRNLALTGMKITESGLRLTNVAGVQITGNEIALAPRPAGRCGPTSCVSNTPNGITLTPPVSGVTIDTNYVHDGSVGVLFRLGHPPLSPGSPKPDTYQNVAIHGNTFSRMGDVVIALQNFEGVTISQNTFADDKLRGDVDPKCHCDAVHAIGGGDDLTLDGNLVYGGRGFLLNPGFSNEVNCRPTCWAMSRAVVENNVFIGRDFGLRVESSPGIRIVNNTIEGPVGSGLGLTFGGGAPVTTGAVVANNLISYFEVASDIKFATEDFNDVSARGTGRTLATPRGPHDISGTPQFVDPQPPAYNFALTSGSLGSQAGSSAYAPPVDQAGWVPRRPPNMGADGGQMPATRPQQVTSVGAAHAGGTSPPGGRGTGPRSSVSRRGRVSIRRSAGAIIVDPGLEVICAPGASCSLEMTVTTPRFRGGASSKHRRRAGRVVVARARRSVAGGITGLVQMRISDRGLARLAGADRFVTISVRVVLSVAPGVTQSSERTVRLRTSTRRRHG